MNMNTYTIENNTISNITLNKNLIYNTIRRQFNRIAAKTVSSALS